MPVAVVVAPMVEVDCSANIEALDNVHNTPNNHCSILFMWSMSCVVCISYTQLDPVHCCPGNNEKVEVAVLVYRHV